MIEPVERKIAEGLYERTTHFPNGMVREEEINMGIGMIDIKDRYPNAYKAWYKMTEDAPEYAGLTEEETRAMQFIRDIPLGETFVSFYDPKQRVKQTIGFNFPSRRVPEEYIKVLVVSNNELEAPPVEDFAAFVNLRYGSDGRMTSCMVQAEKAVMGGRKEDLYLTWKDALPVFVSYLRDKYEDPNADIDSSEIQQTEELDEAQDLSVQLVEEVLEEIPLEDQDEVRNLFRKYGWQRKLMYKLKTMSSKRNEASISKALLNHGRGKFLLDSLESEIAFLQVSNLSVYQTVLEVDNFSDQTFQWKEAELEEGFMSVKPEDKTRVIRNHGETAYGQEVSIQENIFSIERNGNRIKATCLSKQREPLWVAEFQLTIPYQEIVDTYRDENKDFRQIKNQLDLSFQRKAA